MTAVIHEMPRLEMSRTTLSRTLTGRHLPSEQSEGPLAKMQSVSAARAYVRWVAQRHPLSDAAGRADIWAQVGDIISLVPSMPSSVHELDELVHSLRLTLSRAAHGGYQCARMEIGSCSLQVAATCRAARITMAGRDATRIITVMLRGDGARRIDDMTIAR